MTIKNILTKKVGFGSLVALFLASLGLSLFAPFVPQAVAAGETYSWKDYQHIQVSGGDLMQPSILTITSSLAGNLDYRNVNLTVHGTVNGTKTLCNISLDLTVFTNDTNHGTIRGGGAAGTEGGKGRPSCDYSIVTTYAGNVAIQGTYTPPGGGETQAQKAVTVAVSSPHPVSSSPDSITVAYTSQDGQQDSATFSKSVVQVNGVSSAFYQGVFYLDPGTYKFCADAFSVCSTPQTKLKGQPLHVNLGESYSGRRVGVNVVLTFATAGGTPTLNIPALTIHLEDSNGKDVVPPKSTNRVAQPGQEVGGVTSQTQVNLDEVWFDDISAGTYKACIAELNVCQPVVKQAGINKEITITADGTNVQNGSTPGNAQTTPTCETSGWSFNWVFCGIYTGMAKATDWIFTNLVMPYLYTQPICLDPSGKSCSNVPKDDHNNPVNVTYKVWSTFRIYGDIFLIIALLVVVFGQSLGGGLIEAYTAKKILPRLLAAAILINLSIYIVAFLVDVFNIIGGSIGAILTQPLSSNAVFKISPHHWEGVGVTGIIAGTLLAKAAALGSLFSLEGGSLILTGVILPALLVILAILAVVAIRQAIIMALIFVAPVAFALYCLPNTEKYFKKWWDVLVEMLVVYPIIVVLFAVGSILSVTVEYAHPNAGGLTSTIDAILSLVFLIAPLILIPFAFRIAGGVIGKIHDTIVGATRQHAFKGTEAKRERLKHHMNTASIQARQDRYAKMMNSASKGGTFRRNTLGRGLRVGARVLGGYNVEAEASAMRAQTAKEINDQIATGADQEPRGLTVNKAWALRQAQATQRDDGTWTDGQWRMNEGKRQFKTLGGAWVDEASVDAAHQRWGHNTFAQQTALAYEMRKAAQEGDLENLETNYHNVATGHGGWGMSGQQAEGAWIGASFEHQNTHLAFKHTNWQDGSMDLGKAQKYVSEVYEKKGSYQLSQMSSHSILKLQEAYQAAEAAGDVDTQNRVKAIAETFMGQMGPMYDENGTPIAPATGAQANQGAGGDPRRRQANSQGAAHVAERVYELAQLTGVYDNPPAGTHVNPSNTYGQLGDNQRRQH